MENTVPVHYNIKCTLKKTNLHGVNLVNMAQGWLRCQPPLETAMDNQILKSMILIEQVGG
jgi:hypothetical protein